MFFSQSILNPCHERITQISKTVFSGNPDFSTCFIKPFSAVLVLPAFLALRTCSQSEINCSFAPRLLSSPAKLNFSLILLDSLLGSIGRFPNPILGSLHTQILGSLPVPFLGSFPILVLFRFWVCLTVPFLGLLPSLINPILDSLK